MVNVSIRYIVHDVDAAIDFYCNRLGFTKSCTQTRRSRCCRRATCAS